MIIISGGGPKLKIGQRIKGAIANALLLSDGTDLTQSANLTFSGTKLTVAGTITVGEGATGAGNLALQFGTGGEGFYAVTGSGLIYGTAGGVTPFILSGTGLGVGDKVLGFSSAFNVAFSSGFSYISAGLIGVGTGAAGSVAGSLSMNNCKAVSYTVGTTAGASGTFTSVTVVNGIVTAGT